MKKKFTYLTTLLGLSSQSAEPEGQFPPVPKWQPDFLISIDQVLERMVYYFDDGKDIVVFENGTAVILSDSLNDVEAKEFALKTLSDIYNYHPDMNPINMDDGNILVQYNHPAFNVVINTFTNNHIKQVWTKPENKVLGRDGKGLFVYNSGYNTLENNIIDTAEIGIHLTAGSENIKIYGNSFINNPTQVKYVSNKKQEWSKDGRGNYWSNYLGWDMNNDGIGDAIFEPNDGIDKLVWQYPEMKMIMDSPAILILRWVQKQFPVLKPPGVKDSYPLMQSPHINDLSTVIKTLEDKNHSKNILVNNVSAKEITR